MATSGTHTFTLNRNQAIAKAFQLINIYDINSTISSDDLAYANDTLNMMLLYWSGQGIRIWKRKIGYLFPALSTHQYALGPTGTHTSGSYISTEVSTAAVLGASTLTVDSTTGMTAGDFIGVELDDGSRQWTTITTVNSSTLLTLTATLTAASAVDNTVITYTSKLSRPIRIIRGTTKDLKNEGTETMMQPLGFDEYFNLPSKTTGSVPNNFYYDRMLNNGQFYVFPEPNDVTKIITFTYLEALEDTGSATDEIDIPKEWLLPVIWNLGVELAYAYGEFPALDKVEPRANQLFEVVKYYDTDDESLRLAPRY